jgi:hypothetical protein
MQPGRKAALYQTDGGHDEEREEEIDGARDEKRGEGIERIEIDLVRRADEIGDGDEIDGSGALEDKDEFIAIGPDT